MSITPGQANSGSNTARTFLTALVTNAGLLTIEVGAFLILKHRLGRIYSPRTYLPPLEKRAEELPRGVWRWLPALIRLPPEDIIPKNGLDAYMFLRFIKMLIWIFFVFTLISSPILMPVDAVGVSGGTTSGLDRITWSNLANSNQQNRFAAHIVVVYVLTLFVLYMIRREMLHFLHMRHQFLISPTHSRLAQARTVLITSVPEQLANEHDLRQFASFVPGGVDRVWIFRDTKALDKMFEERRKACKKLEAAESKVLREATKAWRVKETVHKKTQKLKPKDVEKFDEEHSEKLILPPPSHELLDELVPPAARPSHRTGFLGILGPKVDTIDWCKAEISRLNVSIKAAREHIIKGKFLGSAFIRCNLQIGAHVLAQCVSYHEPLMMYDKWMEANPKDIVWRNLNDGALEMRTRYVISWLATVGLIIAWAFPVAFVGTLSNLNDLCARLSWLRWVCTAHDPLPGLIRGVLPPALLAILFALLPFILRALAWYECIPRYSLISVSVYRRFFAFLVIHGFLIVTVTSGITKAIEEIIEQPAQTVSELAQELPGASVFFLTYMVTQGLAGAGGALIQLVPLVMHFIRKWFLGRTPRQAYEVTFLMPSADFGIILPGLSLLATIAFAYSVITPLINVLAFVSFSMLYIAWKFLLTQVFDQPDQFETGGLYFPMAISNLFVGLYIEQICLACLFFLKISISRATSLAGGILMLILLAITIAVQVFLHKSFNPITEFLPMSLATTKMAKQYERRRKKLAELGAEIEEEIDMFSRDRIRRVRRRLKMIPQQLDDKYETMKAKVKGDDEHIDKEKEKENQGKEQQTQEARGEATGATPHPIEGAPELYRQPSASSKASIKSAKSEKSKIRKSDESEKPSTTVFDPPAPAGIDLSDEGSDVEDENDTDIHAFDHPSTYVEQAWIWIPKDQLGLSAVLVEDLKKVGVDASDVGAVMQKGGVVEVTRNPPDEEWYGGHDQ